MSATTRKLLLGVLVTLGIGLPINTLWQAVVLAGALVLIACADLRPARRPLLLLGLVFLAGQLLNWLARAPAWEEGHNLFAPSDRNLAGVYRKLPPLALETFAGEYALANPAVPCDRAAKLPWEAPAPCRDDLVIRELFDRSADGIFQAGEHTRMVRKVDLAPERPLSAGLLFDSNSVWHISRENPNKTPLSYYVAYRIIPALEGSNLCWSGTLVWERRSATERAAAGGTCRALTREDVGERLWGFQAAESRPLRLSLVPSGSLRARFALQNLVVLLTTATLLWAGLQPRSLRWRMPALYAVSLAAIYAVAPHLFGGLPGRNDDRDPLLYLSWGRDITFNLLQGEFARALEGGEPVYVFMPGMRYFRAMESFLFGDSGLGYAICLAFIPLIVYGLARQISRRNSLFVALMLISATMLVRAARTAADGYGDPLGFLLIALAVLLFMRSTDALLQPAGAGVDRSVAAAFALLGLAIFVRPNFVLVGILACGVWVCCRGWRALLSRRVLECAGILIVLALPLHNLVFGHRFVPLTLASTLPDALTAPPATYAAAAGELLRFAPGEAFNVISRKLLGWWLPGRWVLFFGSLLIVVLPRAISPKLRLLAAIAFVLQAPHVFYRAGSREMMAANYLALVAVLGAAWQLWERRALRSQLAQAQRPPS